MNTTSRTRHGTLSDLRVIDLTRVYAGPACTQMLADHGADVIKIEPPQGAETRDWGTAGPQGLSSYFWGLNRNKRTLALDFGQAAGREVLLRLLQDADVLIDNFKLGTLERWGLGYANDLQPRFPRLVHLTISGAVAAPIFESCFGPTLAIQRYASEELQRRVLPAVCAGENIKERIAFGWPLADFQAVQLKIAEMAMKLDASRLLFYRAVVNAADGLPSLRESSIAKCFANEIVRQVRTDAMQLMGGYGYSTEYDMERRVRDSFGWGLAG